MKTLSELLELSQDFIGAFEETNERLKEWNTNLYFSVLDDLNKIKNTISSNKFFASNLFVDNNEDNKSHICLRSGKTFIPNSDNEEEWFEINFLQISNGKIYCYFQLNKTNTINYKNEQLELIDELDDLDTEKIIDIVYRGLENYKKHSFLFI